MRAKDLRGNVKKTISRNIISPDECDIADRLINIGGPTPGTIKGTKYAVSTDILGSLSEIKRKLREKDEARGGKVKGEKEEAHGGFSTGPRFRATRRGVHAWL